MLPHQKLIRFVLFPDHEFIKPEKHNTEAITEWVKAFAIYTVAMGKKVFGNSA